MKRVLIIAACIIGIHFFLTWLWRHSLLMFIAGLIAVILIALFAILRSRKASANKAVEKPAPRHMGPGPDADERSIHEQTVRVNQALRLDPGLAPGVLEAFELLIDRIRDLAPRALERFPDSEMTYDLVALGKSHLPGLATRFLTLSPEDRIKAQEDLLCQLRDLAEVVEKAGRALDAGQISDFEAHRDFLKAKFGAA